MTEPVDVAAIRARAEAATEGPWKLWNGWGPTRDGLMGFERMGPESGGRVFRHDAQQDLYATQADAEFIAAARTDVPALCDEVERLRTALSSPESPAVSTRSEGVDTHTSLHGCVFCQLPMWRTHPGRHDVLNIEPLNPVVPGHRIFIPRRHVIRADSDPGVTGAVFQEAANWGAYHAEDFNLITSAGRAATQSVDHLHVHYVPRVEGDGLTLPWTGQKR